MPHYDRAAVPGVQPEVHSQMDVYLANGSYTVRTVYPNGVDPARLYTPAKRPRGGWQLLGRASRLGTEQPGSSMLPRGAWVVKRPS